MKYSSPLLRAMRRSLVVPVNAALLVCFGTWSAKSIGGDTTWNQVAAGVYDWNMDGNWVPAPFPNSPGSIARLTTATGSQTVELEQSITLGKLVLGTAGFSTVAPAYTLEQGAAGTLAFDHFGVGGTATLEKSGFNTDFINVPVTLVDSLLANINGGAVKISGPVSGTFGSGVTAITKVGNGNLILSGSNTYTGTSLVNGGLLTITHANALGAGGAGNGTVVISGGQLKIGGNITVANELLTLSSERSLLGTIVNPEVNGGFVSVGDNSWLGAITLGGASRIYSNFGMLTLGDFATGGNQLVLRGSGNKTFGGAVTGSGFIIHESGTLLFNPTSATGWTGRLRASGGIIRIGSVAALPNNATPIEMNNGTFQVYADAGFTTAGNIDFANNSGTLYLDRALGGTGLNQIFTFGEISSMNSRTFTVNGRNGYGVSFADNLDNGGVVAAGGDTMIFTNNAQGLLTLSGDINLNNAAARAITFNTNNGNVLVQAGGGGVGILVQGGAGAVNLVKAGNGTLFMTGTLLASSITGGTSVNGGVLEVNTLNILGTGTINIGTGTTAPTSTSAPTLRYVGTGDTFTHVINLAGSTGNGRIDASGTGALVLNGNITAGTAGAKSLVLGGTSTAANTINGTIVDSSSGATGVMKVGKGTWVLAGNNTYTGTTQIMNGVLRINANATGTSGLGNTALTFGAVATAENTILSPGQSAGGRFEYNANAAGTPEVLGALNFAAGEGTVALINNGGTSTLTFASLTAPTIGATGNFTTSGGALGTTIRIAFTAAPGTALTNNNAMLFFNGADYAFYDTTTVGSEHIRALNYGTDSTTAAADTFTANRHVSVTTDGNTGGSITLNTVKLSNNATDLVVTGTLTLNQAAGTSGGILSTGATQTISGGVGITTGGAGALVIRVDEASDDLAISTVLTNGTTGGLVKSGLGLLELSGANAYTGTTFVNQGTVRLAGSGTLGAAANGLTVRQEGTVDLNGIALTIGAFNGAGTVTNGSGTSAVLTIGTGSATGLYTGLISGNLGLSKTGTGTIRITGAHTYTGVTTIGGTGTTSILDVVNLADGGAASSIGQSSNAAANLVFNGGILNYIGSTVSTDRSFTLGAGASAGRINSNTGAYLLGGSSTFAGSLIFSGPGPIAFLNSGARTLTLGGASTGDNEIRLQLIDNGSDKTSLSKEEAGLWILGNAGNSYSGDTIIRGGALRALDGTTLPTASNLFLNGTTTAAGGVLETTGVFDRALGTGADQLRWGANAGGFGAWYGSLTVNINGDGGMLTWGTTANFLAGNAALIFQSATSEGTVDFVNALNLGTGAARVVTVNDNGNTTLDYAKLSGVISGGFVGAANDAFIKNGSGTLVLGSNNTYVGNTRIDAGTLVVSKIGSGADASSSLGAGPSVADGGFVRFNGGTLFYIGEGEITDRQFVMAASGTLTAEGTGALVITSNLGFSGATGTRTLTLGGIGANINTFAGIIANNTAGGATSVTHNGSGTWLLSGANTFTGTLTNQQGTLMIANNAALGDMTVARSFVMNDNGIIHALTDLSTPGTVSWTLPGNIVYFTGPGGVTINGTFTANRAGDNEIRNQLDFGKELVFSSSSTLTLSNDASARILSISGTGTTRLSGIINEAGGAAGDQLRITATGVVIMDGAATNSFTGATTIGLTNSGTSGGTLRLNRTTLNPLGTGALQFGQGGILEAAVDLKGANALGNSSVSIIGGTTSAVTSTVTGNQDIDFNGAFTNNGNNNTFFNNLDPSKRLLLSNTVNLSNDGTARRLTIRGFGETQITGQIVNGSTSNSAITYNGALTGKLVLGGATANTFTGGVIHTGGTLVLAKADALSPLGTTAAFQAQGGWLQSTVVGGSTIATSFTLGGAAGPFSYFVNGAQNITFSGTSTNSAGNHTINSDITGAGVLTFSGTVNLSNDSTSRILTVGGAGNTTFSGVIANGNGSTAGAFIKAGSGTVTMIADNTYSGSTTVLGGELALNFSSVTGTKLSSSAALVLGSNIFPTASTNADSNNSYANPTVRLLGHASTAVTETVSGVTLNQGGSRIILTGAGGALTLAAGAITRTQSGATLDVAITGAGVNMSTTNTLVNGILGGYLTLNGTDFAGLSGSNLAVATYSTNNAVNTWTSGINVSNNAVYAGTLGSSLSVNSIRFGFAGGSTITIGSNVNLTVASGGVLVSSGVGNNASTITGGTIDGGAGLELIFHQHNTANTLTVASRILDSNRVVKSGDGTLILSGANAYYGETIINEGLVQADGGSAIGDYSMVTLRNDATAALQINGNETIGSIQGGGAVGGHITFGSNNITVNQLAVTNYGGVLTGSGNLSFQGNGQFRYYGASSASYTGAVSLDGSMAGLIHLLGDGVQNLTGASSFTIKNGSFLIDNNGSRPVNRVGDTAGISLQNARGLVGGVASGLWMRTDQASQVYNWNQTANTADYVNLISESFGALTLAGGDNYARLESTGGGFLRLTADSLVRNAGATFNVRGTNLGLGPNIGITTQRTALTFTNEPTSYLVGGGGAANTTTISVIPWAVGQSVTGAVGINDRGNSFLTFDSVTKSLRSLNLATEYGTNFETLLTNVRIASSTTAFSSAPLGAVGANVLVLDSSAGGAVAVMGDGSGALTLNAGGLLSTSQGGSAATSVGGFTDILTNTSEYVIFTQGAHSLTLNSGLNTAAASLIKSGDGRLILGAASSVAGTVYVNDGFLQLDNTIAAGNIIVNGGSLVSNFVEALNDTTSVNLMDASVSYVVLKSDTINNINAVSGARVNIAAPAVLTINGALNALLTGSGSYAKGSAGTQVFGAGHGYTGGTIVKVDTLQLDNSVVGLGKISDYSAVTVETGATLDFNSVTETVGSLAGGGSVLLGTATLTIGADNTNTNFSGGISGSGGVTKIGTGTQIFSGSNLFTGPLTILGGTMALDQASGNALPDNLVIVLNRGGRLDVRTNETVGQITAAKNSSINIADAGEVLNINYTTAGPVTHTLDSNFTGLGGVTITNTGVGAAANAITLNMGGFATQQGAMTIASSAASTTEFTVNIGTTSLPHRHLSSVALLDLQSAVNNTLTVNVGPNSAINFSTYEVLGGLSSSGAGVVRVNLVNNGNISSVSVGGNNQNTTFNGAFVGNNAQAAVFKTGTGVFTITNSAIGDKNDGVWRVDDGTLALGGTAGTDRLDGATVVVLGNKGGATGSTFDITTGTETIAAIRGGGRATGLSGVGSTNNTDASLGGNEIGGTGGNVNLSAGTTLSINAATVTNVFGGVFTGTGTFQKQGSSNLLLLAEGTSAMTYAANAGVTRLHFANRSVAFGEVASADVRGGLADAATLNMTAGTFETSGLNETIGTLIGTSGTVNLGTSASAYGAGTGKLTINNSGNGTIAAVIAQSSGGLFNAAVSGAQHVGGLVKNGLGNVTLSATNTFVGDLAINQGTITLSGGNAIADTVRVSVSNGATLALSSTEAIGSLSGGGSVNLNLGTARTLILSDNGNTTFSGVISGSGDSALSLLGGTLTLSNSQTYLGITTLQNSAKLVLNGANILADTAVNASAGTLVLGGSSIVMGLGATGLEVRGDDTDLTSGSNYIYQHMGGTGTFQLNSLLRTVNTGATLNVHFGAATTDTANTSAGILGGWAIADNSTWALNQTGGPDGVIVGLANSGYSANVFGGSNSHVDVTTSFGVSTVVANTIRFNSGWNNTITVGVGGSILLQSGGILITEGVGAGTSTITGGTLTASNLDAQEIIIHQHNRQGAFVLDSIITNAPNPTGLTKVGRGTAIITQNNTASGNTRIFEGLMVVGDGGTNGRLTSGSIILQGILEFNLSSTLQINSVLDSRTSNGALNSSLPLFSLGWLRQNNAAGTLVLAADSLAYTGKISVLQGTLEARSSNALGAANTTSGGVFVEQGARLRFGGGPITLAANKVIALEGATFEARDASHTFNGILQVTKDSTIDVGSGLTLTFSGTNDNAIYGLVESDHTFADLAFQGAGGVTQLSQAAVFANAWGDTTIGTGHTVRLGNNNNLGSLGYGSIVNNGTLEFLRNDTVIILDNAITGTGDLIFSRPGSVLLTGGSTSTGNIAVGNPSVDRALVQIGNFGFDDSLNTASGKTVTVTSVGSGLDSHFRFGTQTNLLNTDASFVLAVGTGRDAYLVKRGSGVVQINGTITTSGGAGGNLGTINIDSGTLRFTNGIGTSTNPFAGEINMSGGVLELTGTADTYLGGATGGLLQGTGAVFAWRSTGTLHITSGGHTYSNNRDNLAGLYAYNGTINLNNSGGNAWSNDGYIYLMNGATLQINSAGGETIGSVGMMKGSSMVLNTTLSLNNGAGVNRISFLAGDISGSGGLVKIGRNGGNNETSPSIVLASTNNSFSGQVVIRVGGIEVLNIADAGVNSSLGSGGTIVMGDDGTATSTDPQIRAFLAIHNSTVNSSNRGFLITGTATHSAGGVREIGAFGKQLLLSGDVTNDAGTTARVFQLTGNSEANNTLSGNILQGAGTGGMIVRKESTGRWILSGTNTFSGNLEINNGFLGITSVAATGAAGNEIRLGSGGNTATLEWMGTSTGTFAKNLNFNGTTGTARINANGTAAVVFNSVSITNNNNRTIALGGTSAPGVINIIAGNLVDTGTAAQSLTKDGRATWRLSGANTIDGSFTINAGILQVQGSQAIGDTRTVNVANGLVPFDENGNPVAAPATLELLSNESIGMLLGARGGIVNLNGNTLTILGNTTAQSFQGKITGTGGVTLGSSGNANAFGLNNVENASSGLQGLANYSQFLSDYTGATTIVSSQWHTAYLADVGTASGIGKGDSTSNTTNAASLVLNGGSTNSSNSGLLYQGTANVTNTNRLFRLGVAGTGTDATGIWNSAGIVHGISNGTLNFTNTAAIEYTGSGARTLTLRGTNISNNTFTPIIGDGAGGATSFRKVEGGTWILAGANTYTGVTSVTNGKLILRHNLALGTSAGGTTVSGASGIGIELQNNITITGEALTITGDGGSLGSGGASSNIWAGNVVMNQNARIYARAGSTLEISGIVSSDTNGRAFNKYDMGTVVLSGSNTYSGATSLLGGTLRLNYGANNNSKLADGTSLTLGGTGLATLNGMAEYNNAITHQVWGQGGVLELAGGSHTEIVSATAINNGASRIIRSSGTARIALNVITRSVGGTLDFGEDNIATTDTNNTNGILGGWATVGRNTWAVSVNSGAADTLITGLVAYNNDAYVPTFNTNVVSFAAAATDFTTNTIRFNAVSGGVLNMSGANNFLQSGGILMTAASGAVTIEGGSAVVLRHGTQATAANSHDLVIHQHSASDLTINVVLGENITAGSANTQGLTKTGAGKVILTQDNTFRGTINISEGTLQVGNGGSSGSLGAGGSTFNPVIMGDGTTLILNTTKATEYNFQTISGNGHIILADTNTQTFLLDDANSSWLGRITIDGGILRVRGQNTALGDQRSMVTVNDGGTLEASGSGQTFNTRIVFNEGAVLAARSAVISAVLTNTTATFSGKMEFNNATTAGMSVVVDSAQSLTISGVIQGAKGFTKSGNGTLVLSSVNWVDGAATLSGQIVVSEGTLQLGGDGQQRNLGAVGVNNETIILQNGRINLNNADLNWADLSSPQREIVRISGTGLASGATANTGALINTSGTATLAFLELGANATVGGNSRIDLATYDTDSSSLISAQQPQVDGNNFALSKVGTNELVFRETAFTELAALNIREGTLRLETNAPFIPIRNEVGSTTNPTSSVGSGLGAMLAANVGVVNLNYAGTPTNDAASGVQNVMAIPRLDFYRQHGVVHTTPINFGRGIISLNSDTLPYVYTTLAGTMTLTGAANGTDSLFVIEGGGGGTNVEAGVYRNPFSALIIDADVTGTGGFTKLGTRELIFTKDTSFTGDAVVNRFSNNDFYLDPKYGNQGAMQMIGVALAGAGTFNNASRMVLERGGVLRLVNNSSYNDKLGIVNANNNDRLNNNGQLVMRNGYLVFDLGATANSENIGNVVIGENTATGRTASYIDFDLQSGANVTHNIGIQSITRNVGSVLEFRVYDSEARFGGTTGDSVRLQLLDGGTSIASLLTGSASGVTRHVVQGLFGGIAMIPQDHAYRFSGTQDALGQQRLMFWRAARDFMTTETISGQTYLRPLDDSEYSQNAFVTGGNVNISEISFYQRDSMKINTLRLGNLNDNLGNNATSLPGTRQVEVQDSSISLFLDDNVVLNIASGMVMGASWSEGGLVNGQQQVILGGTLQFGSKEAIFHVVGGGYATDFGGIRGDNRLEVRSTIAGTGGLTKSGTTELRLDGRNTFSGLTTVTNGNLYIRNGEALGAGNAGAFDGTAGPNGNIVTGWGQILQGNGSNIGSANAREDLYVGVINQSAIVLRSDTSVNSWTGNIIIDNVDNAGMVVNTPVIQTNSQDTLILNGSIAGGSTLVLEDGLATSLDSNPRVVTFNSADTANGDGWILLKKAIGDRYVGGQAVSIADTVSTQTTIAGVRTNENQALAVTFNPSSNEAIYETYESWAAVGRLTMNRGWLRYMGDGDFYAADTVAKMGITSTNLPSGNVGIRLGNGADGGVGALLLTKAGQSFAASGQLNWQQINNNANGLTIIGGENENGVVTFGNGAGRFDTERLVAFHASMGGEVQVKFQITTGGGAADFMSKIGRGTVRMLGSTLGGGNINDVGIFGGTMIYDYRTNNTVMNDNTAILKLGGGTLHLVGNATADTTQNFQRAAGTGSTSQNTFSVFSGGSQIVGEAAAGRALNINIGADAFGLAQPNRTITRNVGGTVGFVGTGAGTVNITLAGANVPRNVTFGWATYGTSIHTALDFAMVDATDVVANKVKAINRNPGHNVNNVAAWGAGMDVSENGGAGFTGILGANLAINTLHFDASTESLVNLGSNTLTVSGGGILVSSEVGSFNKTITGGVLTTSAVASSGMMTNGELIIHQYGSGILTIGSTLGDANLTSVVINGVQTTINEVLGASPTLTPGTVRLTAAGGNQQRAFYLNGGILEVSNENQLGLVDIASVTNLLFLNGGTFRWTGTGTTILDEQRQIQVGGNGGVIDVANSDAVLGIQGEVFTDVNTTNLMTGAGAAFGGNDIIKKGAGTLLIQDLTDANVGFGGLLDIREGTLRVSGARSNSGTAANTIVVTNMFGTNRSWLDATIFRQGTNLEFRMGDLQTASHVYQMRENFRFDGNNVISMQRAGANAHIIHLDGVIDLEGAVTVDITTGHVMRWNNDGGYLTGSGNLIKTGLGELQLRENSPDWTGSVSILQGKLLAGSQGKPLGSGTGAITLGSAEHTGLAWLSLHNETGLPIALTLENDINVIYNPLQTKRLGLTLPAANGQDHYLNGDITMGDHLALYIEDSTIPTGGKFDWIHFNGQFKDDLVNNRSGNLVLRFDNTSGVENDTNTNGGQSFGYFNFNNDNSGWSGDVVVATNASYFYNETTILRLGHDKALTEKNEVTMNFNSRLQVAGNNVTIGGLITQGGSGQPQGSTGSSEFIENAAATEGTLTIKQTTPAEVEVLWDAYFQDGTTASHFIQPDSGTTSSSLNLVKDGLGWATLTLNNNYTGLTTVAQGTLQVGRNGFGDTGADYNTKGTLVNAGATLAGTGVVQGGASVTHQVNGNLKPGDFGGEGNGTLTFNGNTAFGSTANIYFQISHATFNAPEVLHIKDTAAIAAIPAKYATTLNDIVLTNQHDHVEINGTLTVDANTKFIIVDNGYNPVAGDVFNLIDWVGASLTVNTGGEVRFGGLLGALDLPNLGPDYRWDTSLFNSAGILVVTSVPEPGRMALLLLGLIVLFGGRCRRKMP
ncbi:autotransporter-associated beta strand repeat-containing protein [Verrucomicrobium sp. BvORR034]|uniref:autotransporter-associated beta strand repeat-containing protein n=1 Tax=Verrucomicrobium sp. BvORR034 TaxID=1396418 RepID=UPI000679735D|nr:autotransporter-associated beta strand repeat-containing protein [Verrucomicrobium sp. BvORR034]